MQVVAAQGETARPGMKVLATIMPVLGYGGMGPGNRPVPSKVYFDLATWQNLVAVMCIAPTAQRTRSRQS